MSKLATVLTLTILSLGFNGCSMSISPTPTLAPTATSSASAVTIVPSVVATPITDVQIALVNEIGTPSSSTFGCGDQIEMVHRTVNTTTPLKTAIQELLSIHNRNYGASGLTTALYQNNFTVSNVTITGNHADIDLTGSIMIGGACDNPRIEEQMKRTILQFPSIQTYQIKLNGTAHNWNCLFNLSGSC